MDQEGVGEALTWAEAEGWQPGLGDQVPLFAADPQGYFCAVRNGRMVATISVVRGSDTFAFVGLYIVDPELRGQGFGKALWDQALEGFDGFTLGLDAVPEQVDTYASDGFVPAYGNARYSADASSLPDPDGSTRIEPATAVDFDQLVAFDAAHFFSPRPDFLRPWIEGTGRRAAVATDRDEITGFAASRPTSAGHRLGPVFAQDADVARELILTLAADLPGPVALDLFLPNQSAVEMVESLGMEQSFATTRMYRGTPPDLPLDRIFGITSLELG